MAKTAHKHEWKLSYTLKIGEVVNTTYYCKPCGAFKKEEGKPAEKERASNMGGEFSTNWSAS